MSRSKPTIAEKAETARCLALLRKWIRPGATVYTSLVHVSSSGMSRDIAVHMVNRDRSITNISGYVAEVLGWPRGKHGGVRVAGCGMDMGFHIVDTLGYCLFPHGGPLAKAVGRGRRTGKEVGHESSGGYLLRHEWI